MADQNRPSVAEILAKCRQDDGGAAAASSSPPAAADSAPPKKAAAGNGDGPAKKPSTPQVKPGERPSIADMMAMARGEKSAEAETPADKTEAAKPVTAGKASATAASTKKPEPAKATTKNERLDTASILAAARGGAKPGPVSKAEYTKQTGKPAVPEKPAKPLPPMPAKPAYAKPPAPRPRAEGESRRFFLVSMLGALVGSALAIGFTSLAAVGGLWSLAVARFMFPNVLTEPPSRFKVGFPGDFPFGMVEEKFKAQFGVWVVNYEYNGERQIFALSTVCTHLGCTPNWLDAEQKYKCPCHGSGFYKDGINFEGPAPRPLERYAIRIGDDGQLEVDKSRKFQEEMGQWADPASFVTV
ncbi:MAG: Rieske 2Fe-2S domain-containing protein [Pirellulales bacterium]